MNRRNPDRKKEKMKSTELTREELEADHVADGIAKWGECERAGLEKQAREKSLETLRVDYDCRHGDEQEAVKESLARQRAAGAPEIYPEYGLEANT